MMVYDSHSSNFLKSYKFYHNFSYAKILIELLKNWISKQDEVFCINNKINHNIKKKIKKNISEKIDLIIPMPLHKLRLIKRGFNQTICFAKVLSEYFDTKLSLNLVKKVKSTKTQSRLDASKRRENLLGAFKVDKNKLKGVKRVLLVDDVMTTGSTAHILAKSLKKAGVQWVGVFVLLRAF
jgi:ComF family protein